MKCDKCGYSDNGTGDSAHTCFVHALKQEEHKMTDSEQQEFKKSLRELNQQLIDIDNKRKVKLIFSHSYGEESYGLVYQNELGSYDVYEIPQYGGYEEYYRTYNSIEDAVQAAKSFT